MGVTSIRFNAKEEKVLKYLKDYYHCDSSTLLKKSLWEMYEDIQDSKIIEEFEKKEKKNMVVFEKIDSVIS